MRSDSDLHEPRTNAEQSETGAFRVSYESGALQRARRGQPQTAGRHLYFIQVAKGRGPVKIGRANDPNSRLRALQVACPYRLKLLGMLNDCGHAEPDFHIYLARDRLQGEWFGWTKRVEEVVKLALAGGDWRAKLAERDRTSLYDDWRVGSPLYEKAGAPSGSQGVNNGLG
jgi:hypothetical protein